MRTVSVNVGRLHDIPALEAALEGRLLSAQITGERAEVTVLPVADLRFFVNVWNCQAEVYVVRGGLDRPGGTPGQRLGNTSPPVTKVRPCLTPCLRPQRPRRPRAPWAVTTY